MNFTQSSQTEATDRALPAGACDCHAHVDAALGPLQAPFRTLLELVSSPLCWVKLSGADRLAKKGTLQPAVSFAQSLAEVAPERVVWGTDWPHVNLKESPSDEALFRLLAQVARSLAHPAAGRQPRAPLRFFAPWFRKPLSATPRATCK
jgi:predicted TIM-barrel fold metal-dependent hydrolase